MAVSPEEKVRGQAAAVCGFRIAELWPRSLLELEACSCYLHIGRKMVLQRAVEHGVTESGAAGDYCRALLSGAVRTHAKCTRCYHGTSVSRCPPDSWGRAAYEGKGGARPQTQRSPQQTASRIMRARSGAGSGRAGSDSDSCRGGGETASHGGRVGEGENKVVHYILALYPISRRALHPPTPTTRISTSPSRPARNTPRHGTARPGPDSAWGNRAGMDDRPAAGAMKRRRSSTAGRGAANGVAS